MSSIQPNSDFLSSSDDTEKVAVRKRRTTLEIEQDEYPEYHSLNDYEKKCLAPNNYWRVMYGMEIIKVPPSDKNYHKYFDKRCYDLCFNFQKQKKAESIEKEAMESVRKSKEIIIEDTSKEVVLDTPENIVKVNAVIEKEAEVIKPIEPIKVAEVVKKIEPIKVVEPPVMQKPKKVQEKKVSNSNEEQISLF